MGVFTTGAIITWFGCVRVTLLSLVAYFKRLLQLSSHITSFTTSDTNRLSCFNLLYVAATLSHVAAAERLKGLVKQVKCRNMRHTSLVTRHTSHVTRHTSHVTRHTPHATRHTSHITHHTSHVTRHTSHVTHLTPRHSSHENAGSSVIVYYSCNCVRENQPWYYVYVGINAAKAVVATPQLCSLLCDRVQNSCYDLRLGNQSAKLCCSKTHPDG
jgi:hypothetical protein